MFWSDWLLVSCLCARLEFPYDVDTFVMDLMPAKQVLIWSNVPYAVYFSHSLKSSPISIFRLFLFLLLCYDYYVFLTLSTLQIILLIAFSASQFMARPWESLTISHVWTMTSLRFSGQSGNSPQFAVHMRSTNSSSFSFWSWLRRVLWKCQVRWGRFLTVSYHRNCAT